MADLRLPGQLTAADFEPLAPPPPRCPPVASRALAQMLCSPIPDTDSCSIPPGGNGTGLVSPIYQSGRPVPAPPASGFPLLGSTQYSFVLDPSGLTPASIDIGVRTRAPQSFWRTGFPVDNWQLQTGPRFRIITDAEVIDGSAGAGIRQLDQESGGVPFFMVGVPFVLASDGLLQSIEVNLLDNMGAGGVLVIHVRTGGGGAPEWIGDGPGVLLTSSNAVLAAGLDGLTPFGF